MIKVDVAKVWSVIEGHPVVAADLLGTLATNAKTIPALVAVAKSGFTVSSLVAFAKTHKNVTIALLNQATKAATEDPALFDEVLTAAVEVAAEATGAV